MTLDDIKASYEEILQSHQSRRLVVRAPGLRHTVAARAAGGGSEETLILHAPSFKQEKGFSSDG